MFTPKYRLTPDLLSNITSIERLYGQLESLHIPQVLELNLERDNLVKSSYISNSIEGNPLSLPEVTNLLLDERVPVNRDEKEVKNYFSILQSLPTLEGQPFSTDTVKSIHKELMTGTDDAIAGKIRNTPVVVGGYVVKDGKSVLQVKHEPPFHDTVGIERALGDIFDWVREDSSIPPVLKVGIFHHQYVYIHPFEDGNGRTCRLLTALLLLKNNYRINKYFVLDDYYDIDRLGYSDKLNTADKGDETEWLEYFTEGMKYSLQSALSKVSTALLAVRAKNRPTLKEQEVLVLLQQRVELTSDDIVTQFHVSRQQAHKVLAALVSKGFAKKIGNTKKTHYILK